MNFNLHQIVVSNDRLFYTLLLFLYLLPVGMIFPKLIGTSGFGIMSTFLIQKIVKNEPHCAAMLICF